MEEKKISDKKEVENVSIEISQKKKQAVLLPSYTKIYSQTRIKSTTIDYTWQIDRFLHLTRSIDMLCSPWFSKIADYKIQINVERTASPVIKFYLLSTKAFTGSCTITLAFPHDQILPIKSVWGYISGRTLLTEITTDFFTSLNLKFAYTDTLTIRCELEIFYKEISDTMHVNLQSSSAMFSKDMRSLKDSTLDESEDEINKSEDETTIYFKVGKEKYVVSRKLLHATNSNYFKNICLTHKGEEKDMTNELTDIELKTFQEMLIFIITGLITSNDYNMLTKLLTTADKYDVPTLKLTCEHYLIRDITLYNVVDLIQLAFWHNAELLKTHSVAFIKFNMKEVMNTKEFRNLPQESANKIMELIDKTKVLEKMSNDQFLSSGPRTRNVRKSYI